MTALNKTGNAYVDEIDPVLYATTPKAVFAALFASFVLNHLAEQGEDGSVNAAILREWSALHENGIVPQKPPRLRGNGR